MRTVLTTNDPVRLSYVLMLLRDLGIDAVVFDSYAASADGSIGAIPRRVMVDDDDEAQARRLLAEAGET